MAKRGKPLIIAHRGAHFGVISKENTMKAFQKAHKIGIRGIELDVVLSADKIPIVVHQDWTEPTLERLTRGKTKASALKLTLAKLKRLGIQSFEQVIDWALKKDMELFVELKETKKIKELAKYVADIIIKKKATNISYVFSKSSPLMKEFKKYKKIKKGLRNSCYSAYDDSYYIKQAKTLDLDFIFFHTATLTPNLAKKLKIKVGVWRRGRSDHALQEIKSLLQYDLDLIITDLPEGLK